VRSIAAVCLVLAAFGVHGPWLDRPGMVLLALAFVAVGVRGVPRARGPALARPIPPKRVTLPAPDEDAWRERWAKIGGDA
jgi:hypothetical protein